MSKRHSTATILDAVRDCVLDLGVRRTTAAEVARRAGVSRMTLYRTFPDVNACVSALMTREFGALIVEAQQLAGVGASARERLIDGTLHIAEHLPNHPLFARVLDVDPELLLPYVFDRLGGTQRAGIALFEHWLVEGQQDGSIRAGGPELLAYCLQLVVQGFVLSHRITVAEQDQKSALGELRLLLDAYLRPQELP
jgi:AcrR family transcriptional regulator